MNQLAFIGTKVEEDPKKIINKIYKILKTMHISKIEGI